MREGINPIVNEVVMTVFNDLYPDAAGDPDAAQAKYAERGGLEILEASPLLESLGGVQLVKELAETLAEIPFYLIARGGPMVVPQAILAGLASAISAGAVLARRADAANAELPPVE